MSPFEPIKLVEIIAEEVGAPRNDGTPGSALYQVPIRLSATPPVQWRELFVRNWNSPPHFTSMHRPGIASVSGDRVILNGTTLDEIERYHRATLLLAVEESNKQYAELLQQAMAERDREDERQRQFKDEITKKAKEIRFDQPDDEA